MEVFDQGGAEIGEYMIERINGDHALGLSCKRAEAADGIVFLQKAFGMRQESRCIVRGNDSFYAADKKRLTKLFLKQTNHLAYALARDIEGVCRCFYILCLIDGHEVLQLFLIHRAPPVFIIVQPYGCFNHLIFFFFRRHASCIITPRKGGFTFYENHTDPQCNQSPSIRRQNISHRSMACPPACLQLH